MVREGRKNVRMDRTMNKYAGEKKARINEQEGTSISWNSVLAAGINLIEKHGQEAIDRYTEELPDYSDVDEDLSGDVLLNVTDETHGRGMDLRSEDIAWETMAQVGINSLEQRHTMDVMATDGGSLTREDVEETVDQRIGAALEQFEGGDGMSETRIRELAREMARQEIADNVAHGALDPDSSLR